MSDEPREAAGSPEAAHDPYGGELARSIARSYRGAGRSGAEGTGGGGRRRGPVGGGRTGGGRAGGRPGGWMGREPRLSGARPDERDPQSLERLMTRLVGERGWATDVAVHGVFSRWDSIVGGEVAAHCRPEQYVDGRLAVRADSTAWATQVRLLAPTVLQRLHDELGENTVTRIDVRGPDAPSWGHGRFRVAGRGPRDTYG